MSFLGPFQLILSSLAKKYTKNKNNSSKINHSIIRNNFLILHNIFCDLINIKITPLLDMIG